MGQWLTLAHGNNASSRERAGGRRARLFEPMEPTTGLVVFVHGGECRQHRRLPRRMCVPLENHWAESAFARLPLAWQAQFPAAFDDVVAGFREAVDRADEVRASRARQAETSLRCPRWRSVPTPNYTARARCADLSGRGRRSRPLRDPPHLFPRAARPGDRAPRHAPLRPDDADRLDPRFAVMAASDLSAMPPAYIATAGMDVLRDDQAQAFGERAPRVRGRGRERAAVPEPPARLLDLLVESGRRAGHHQDGPRDETWIAAHARVPAFR